MKTLSVLKNSKTLWHDSVLRLKKNKGAMISFYFLAFICFIAVFAAQVAPHSFETQNMEAIYQSPSQAFWLGTDGLGRDLLSRLIYGARMSMAVGILTAFISMFLGTIYGGISGWYGGRIDAFMMRTIDILMSFPSLILMILVKVIFDSVELVANPELRALTSILLALSIVGWVTLARVVRGQVLQVKQLTYVEAAQALGTSTPRILLRYIFPNILGPIIVLLTFQIPSNILYESFLSFIGLGLQPPYSSWGVLVKDGYSSFGAYPYLIFPPALALFITMLAFNLFGDGLRDAFDPKLRK